MASHGTARDRRAGGVRRSVPRVEMQISIISILGGRCRPGCIVSTEECREEHASDRRQTGRCAYGEVGERHGENTVVVQSETYQLAMRQHL